MAIFGMFSLVTLILFSLWFSSEVVKEAVRLSKKGTKNGPKKNGPKKLLAKNPLPLAENNSAAEKEKVWITIPGHKNYEMTEDGKETRRVIK